MKTTATHEHMFTGNTTGAAAQPSAAHAAPIPPNPPKTRRRVRQGGYSFLEFMIMGAVIALLAVFSLPKVSSWLAEGKVEPTANDFTGAVMRIRANAEGASSMPYQSMTTAVLANTLRDRSTALQVNGTGTSSTLTHKLGATGSTVTAQPVSIATTYDGFQVTFNGVNTGACPSLSTMLQNTADSIALNGTTVKTSGAAYSGQSAQNLCTDGNTNTYVFTFR